MLHLTLNQVCKISGKYRQGISGNFMRVPLSFKLQEASHDKEIVSAVSRMAAHYKSQTDKELVISVLWKGAESNLKGEVQLLDETTFLQDISLFFGRQNVHVNVKANRLSYEEFQPYTYNGFQSRTVTAQGEITTKDMKVIDYPEKTCEDTSILFPSIDWLRKFKGDIDEVTCYLTVTLKVELPTDQTEKQKSKIDRMAVYEKMLHDEIHSDAVIIAKDGSTLKCHRSVLSASSPVLETMFQTDMVEGNTHRIEIPDMSEQGVKAFLEYIYYLSVEAPSQNSEVAFELLNAGHKYNVVPHLEEAMKRLILSKPDDWMDVEVAVKTFCLARNLPSCEDMKMKCVKVMKKKLDELVECESYNELFTENPLAAMELCLCSFALNRTY